MRAKLTSVAEEEAEEALLDLLEEVPRVGVVAARAFLGREVPDSDVLGVREELREDLPEEPSLANQASQCRTTW